MCDESGSLNYQTGKYNRKVGPESTTGKSDRKDKTGKFESEIRSKEQLENGQNIKETNKFDKKNEKSIKLEVNSGRLLKERSKYIDRKLSESQSESQSTMA